jgi:adenylate cyclase
MTAKLIVKDSASGQSFVFDLSNNLIRIGRAADRNDLVLDDGQVSREHAIIRHERNGYVLEDLNSANGTFMDGKRVKERPLATGDIINISRYSIELKDLEAAVSIKEDSQRMGSTFLFKKPAEVSILVPEIDRASIATQGPSSQSVIDYIESLRKKADTLARIYELNQVLGADFDQEVIFKKVSEMVFRLTNADRFFVLLKDSAGELATVAAEFRSTNNSGKLEKEIALSKTVVDRVMTERVSLLSFDTQADERFLQAKSIILQNIRSVMCAPILAKGDILGVIYADCRELTKLLNEDDLEMLNAVAAQTSIAIDNAVTHRQLVREELARAKYRRFMPKFVVDEILANPDTLNLGGTNSLVTMLFSDIRNFTSMSEGLKPEVVVQMLNEYFADMTPIVFEHRGLLDKYIGDGMMALFGVPYASEMAAADAVAAAVAMQRRMAKVNEDLRGQGLEEIAIGIGINTGMVTVGYIGSEERTDYTAIGDPVNLAARLEKQAKAGQIIISRTTREALGDQFPVRPAGEVTVRGRKETVQIFEVLWKEVVGDLTV